MASCANHNHDCIVPGVLSNDTFHCMCQLGFSGWRCETDDDECSSTPCHNDARCSDSNSDSSIDAGTYQCECVHGYTSGESGNCDIDVDECASAPCQNGATCADSTTNTSVPTGGYRCLCVDGYTSGTCEYFPVVESYAASCAITLSSDAISPGDGNCAVDVDECASQPCQNGGVCKESVSSDGTLSPRHLRRVLERFDVMFADSQFKAMVMKIDEDNDGRVSIDEFMKFFGKGQASDKEVFATISGVSAQEAKRMVQQKLQGRIEGGPSGLRRAYSFFDRDGSGSIDLNEFRIALKRTCGLVFDDTVTQELFRLIDPDGSGSLDFNEFCAVIMDSKNSALETGTSLNTNAAALKIVNDHNCNSIQFLRRKVRENWKALLIAFKQHTDAHGPLDRDGLREILYRFDILPADSQLDQLIHEIDADNDGTIDHQEFMSYWAPGQKEDLLVTGGPGTVGNKRPGVQEAMDMIRSAIESRLASAPGGLRRAFKLFDRDGSGQITTNEFRDILKHHVMLEFDETTMAAVMSHFDPDGTGGIDFNEFCTLVMGESRTGPFGTGATADIPSPPMTFSADGDIIKTLREKMLVSGGQSATPCGNAAQLVKLLKLQDADGSGHVSASVLKRSLARAGVPLSEEEFTALASVVVERKHGTVDYAKLTEALRTGNSAVYNASLNRGTAPPGSQSGKRGTSLQGAGKKEREALWAAAAVEATRSPSRQSSQHSQQDGAAIVADLEAIASLPRNLVMTPSKATGRRGSNANRGSRQQSDSGGRPLATAGSNRGSSRRGSYR